MAYKLLAQRILTGDWLDTDLPYEQCSTRRELSGPGLVQATVPAELAIGDAGDGLPVLAEWATALYVAARDGSIRGGGIVTSAPPEGQTVKVQAPGFSYYPNGQPYFPSFTPSGFEDPLTMFRRYWNYVQSATNSDLGVVVDSASTWLKLGSSGGGPYRVRAQEYPDIGTELNNIAQAARTDWVEEHQFSLTTPGKVDHRIRLGFPRCGVRRYDLRFVSGENVISFNEPQADGERYANDLLLRGRGGGSAQARARLAVRNDGRLRRSLIVDDPSLTKGRIAGAARRELARRSLDRTVDSLTIIADHPHAPVTSISLGDDITFAYDSVRFGPGEVSLRVTAIEEDSTNPGRAVLTTMRSDYFDYFPANNPDPSTPTVVQV